MTTDAHVVSEERYHAAYLKALDKTPYRGFLTEFTLADLKAKHGLVCYLTPDEQCGVAIYQGPSRFMAERKVYAIGLFNVGNVPGAGYSLFQHVVNDKRVTDIDAFEGPLTTMYESLGFETVERVEFDPQYAHDWNYERDGRPAVCFMRRER